MLGAGLAFNDEQGVDVPATQNVEALFTLETAFYTYDRPKTNFDLSVQYYPSLSDTGRQRLQLDAGAKRELWKDLFAAITLYTTLRQPASKPHGRYARRWNRAVDRLDLLVSSEGLCPSDSPTRALARAVICWQFPVTFSRLGSLIGRRQRTSNV